MANSFASCHPTIQLRSTVCFSFGSPIVDGGSHLILTNEASTSGNTPSLSFGPIAAEGRPPVFGGKTDAQHGGDNVFFWMSFG